jgi:RNA polymerase primary sigma factor
MPRVAKFRIPAIADLLRQLEYTPNKTRMRQMNAAEELLADIEPEQAYPHDFVVFRITGYRPDSTEEPFMLVGSELVHDLVALIQRLSRDLEIPIDEAGRRAIALQDVESRLRVSRKTLQRYRRDGLVCHYVVFPDGIQRLACFEDALERFQSQRTTQLKQAAEFTRIDDSVRKQIIVEARRLHDAEGLTLNQAAQVLAQRNGRAHETVRNILARYERRGGEPIFQEHGPLSQRQVRLIHRAWRAGIPIATLLQRFGKSRAAIQHAINRRRGELLHQFNFSWVALPTFDREDAAAVILAAPAVNRGLDQLLPSTEAGALLDAAHGATAPDEDAEHAMLAALNLLKREAAARTKAMEPIPGAEVLDETETALRWCTLLKRRLVSLALPSGITAVEQSLHRPLIEQPAEVIRDALEFAVQVARETVEMIDPSRGQRLERMMTQATDRALARRQLDSPRRRAAARHGGAISLDDLLGPMQPWQPLLDPRPDLAQHRTQIPDDLCAIVSSRYGWDGGRPHTCAELAALLDVTPAAVSRRVRQAEQMLRQMASCS